MVIDPVSKGEIAAHIRAGEEIKLVIKMPDGTRRERFATPEETKIFLLIDQARTEDLHKVWWEFCDRFMGGDAFDPKWTLTGWKLMEAVEKFAEEFPDHVKIAGCDDDWFMSSDLVFIRHGTGDNYMGESVVYIPQRGGTPAVFFLYPGHIESLREILNSLPSSPSSMKEAYERKPSPLDAIDGSWREKPWYKETGLVEKLEAALKEEDTGGIKETS